MDPKEPSYFAPDVGSEEDATHDHDWYEALFDDAGDAIARGESSTSYTKAPKRTGAAPKIAALIPDVRLVYVVRNPIDRIASMYRHRGWRGVEDLHPISRAVRENPDYLDTSRYAYQLAPYLETFPRDQLLVVSSERLRNDRKATLREIFSFIGVDAGRMPQNIDEEVYRSADRLPLRPSAARARDRLQRIPGYRRIPKSLRRRVRHLTDVHPPKDDDHIDDSLEAYIWSELTDDLRRLREIVGPDFDLWGHA